MGTGRSRRRPVRISVPSRADSLLRKFTALIGGPLGRRTSPGVINPGLFSVERVLVLLTTGAAVIAVLLKNPCRIEGWSSPGQYYMACQSQWPEAFDSLEGGTSFLQLGHSALTGAFAGVTAHLVPLGSTLCYYDFHSILAVAAWLLIVYATVRMTNRRPWDAAMVAVAPVIIVAGFLGWDLWAAMFAALGMLAFARSRFAQAGIFLGLGTAVAGYPVLIFGAVALLACRTRLAGGPAMTGVVLAATWLAVNLPFGLLDSRAWSAHFTSLLSRDADYSSIWFAYTSLAARADGRELEASFTTVASGLLTVLLCAGVAALTLRVQRRPRLAQVAFLLVGVLILAGKGYSPQHAIWLVPLVALAYPKWRTFLLWQFLEVAHWWTLMMYLGKESSGGDAQNNIDLPYYLLFTFAHMLATAYIMYRVMEGMIDPARDPVRRLDIDDPQGGLFDHAADYRKPARSHAAPNGTQVRLTRPSPEPKDHP
ncbi:putative membrane protein [Arthrobacter sp. CAN_A212]|uniref:glycosyltransferase family 87 protein n=1 Tax=Arthrobacter sp. CAN_A212 TaxID=2787719 RepID=UPI0018C9A755